MIRLFNKTLAILFTALALSACAVTTQSIVEEGGAKMSGAEIQQLYGNGLKVAWTSANGGSGTGEYSTDGTAKIAFGSTTWVGTWRVDNDALCTSYPERGNGEVRCFSTYKRAGGGYSWFTPDGKHGGDMTIVQ